MILEFFSILTIILLILIIFPLICLIYKMFPRNKNKKEIYHQPPIEDSPAFINSLFSGGINKMVGEINIKSFYITLLDLINRKYISVKIVRKKDLDNKTHNKKENLKKFKNNEFELEAEKSLDKIILKINKKSIDKIYPFEKNVLKCIYALENKGTINLLDTKESLRKRLKVNNFQKNYDAWMKNFHEEFFKDNKLKFFNNRFDLFLKIYGAFLGVIFVVTVLLSYFEESYLNMALSFITGALGLYLIIVPFKTLGGWTKEGKKLELRWNSFKRYYGENLKSSNKPQGFLEEGINYLPYLYAMGISKSILLRNFSHSNNVNDTYIFLKYGTDSLVNDIVKDFLAADGTFDPKYYNTSGNFVPGFGL